MRGSREGRGVLGREDDGFGVFGTVLIWSGWDAIGSGLSGFDEVFRKREEDDI